MNELTDTTLKKPLDKSNMGTDAAALRGLVDFVNNPEVTGAVVPPEGKQEIADTFKQQTDRHGATIFIDPSPVQAEATTPTANPPATASVARKIFFTGKLCAGKDFVAKSIGATVLGFADPMYVLAEYLFNVKIDADNKALPGIRKTLQTIGQWGRNETNEQYPLTPERAMFCLMVRSLANQKILANTGTDFGLFGLDQDIWVKSVFHRSLGLGPARVAVTNCRFANEYKSLTAGGFEHWHILCSPVSWTARLAQRKLTPESPELRDMSEKLAHSLDADLTKKLSAQRTGNKLRVIWSDPSVPPPSNRIYTLEEFIRIAS